MKSISLLTVTILLFAVPVSAQDVPFEGMVRVQPVGSGALLPQMSAAAGAVLRSSDVAWVGYEFTVRENFHDVLFGGFSGSFRGTFVNGIGIPARDDTGLIRIGSPTRTVLHLYRSGSDGKPYLDKITFLDPAERVRFSKPLVWLTGVDARRSIEAHAEIARRPGKFDDRDDALAMLALHDSDAGLATLREFILGDNDEDEREDALTWYGLALLPGRYDELKGLETQIRGAEVREELTFLYYRAGNEDAVHRLLSMARDDASEDVREQAAFWLGQLANRRMAAKMGIDPDDESSIDDEEKHALFALSRMESGRSREALVRLVRTGKNYGIRKQALFWLTRDEPDGQVIDLLEELLRN